MHDAPKAVEDMLAKLIRDHHAVEREEEQRRASADPQRYKLSRVFPKGVSAQYRFHYAGRDGRAREVRFCYSINRNVAGFYLGWREIIGKKGGKRDQWLARRVRRKCSEIALRRAEAFKTAHA